MKSLLTVNSKGRWNKKKRGNKSDYNYCIFKIVIRYYQIK